MHLLVIDADRKKVQKVEVETFEQGLKLAGLKADAIGFGTIGPSHMIAVYEFGLFEPKETMQYFSVREQLYAGNAVIYQVGEQGETVDVQSEPMVRFFKDAAEVERAIEDGDIRQPSMTIDGEVIWVWPQSAPPGTPLRSRKAQSK